MIDKIVSTRIRGSKNPFGQAAHDSRRKLPGYLKSRDDAELVSGSMEKAEIAAAIAGVKGRYKERHGRSLPRNANPMLEGVITFGTGRVKGPGEGLNPEEKEEINGQDREEMDAAARRFLEWMEVYHGTKSVYLTRHENGQEATVHYHFMVQNYNRNTGKSLTSGMSRQDFVDLQDYVAVCYEPLQFSRGLNKKISSRDYKTVSEGHTLRLQHQNQEVEKLFKRSEVYKQRYEKRLEELGGSMEEIAQKADTLSRLAKDAERQAKALTKTLEYLDEELKPQVIQAIEEARDRAKQAQTVEKEIRATKPDQASGKSTEELARRRQELREQIKELRENGPELSGPGM